MMICCIAFHYLSVVCVGGHARQNLKLSPAKLELGLSSTTMYKIKKRHIIMGYMASFRVVRTTVILLYQSLTENFVNNIQMWNAFLKMATDQQIYLSIRELLWIWLFWLHINDCIYSPIVFTQKIISQLSENIWLPQYDNKIVKE